MNKYLIALILPSISALATDLGECRRQAERNANGAQLSYLSEACVEAAVTQVSPQLKIATSDLRYIVAGMENFVVVRALPLHGEKEPPVPQHVLAGQATLLNHVAAIAVDVKQKRIAVLENESGKPHILIFSLDADGNTAPLHVLSSASLSRAHSVRINNDFHVSAADADGAQVYSSAFPK